MGHTGAIRDDGDQQGKSEKEWLCSLLHTKYTIDLARCVPIWPLSGQSDDLSVDAHLVVTPSCQQSLCGEPN